MFLLGFDFYYRYASSSLFLECFCWDLIFVLWMKGNIAVTSTLNFFCRLDSFSEWCLWVYILINSFKSYYWLKGVAMITWNIDLLTTIFNWFVYQIWLGHWWLSPFSTMFQLLWLIVLLVEDCKVPTCRWMQLQKVTVVKLYLATDRSPIDQP